MGRGGGGPNLLLLKPVSGNKYIWGKKTCLSFHSDVVDHRKINCFDMWDLIKQNWLSLWESVTPAALWGYAMDCGKHMWLKSFKWVSNKRGRRVWLKLSEVPQEAGGPLPGAGRACGIQTGDSQVTGGSALEERWGILGDLATFLQELF